MKKICKKCKIEKEITGFKVRNKITGNISPTCKKCNLAQTNEARRKNKVKVYARKRELRALNLEEARRKDRERDAKNKEKRKEQRRRPEALAKAKAQKKIYRADPVVKARENARQNLRRKTNKLYRLKCTLRTRLGNFVKSIKNGTKLVSSVNDLGCSLEFFKVYIENKFDDKMTWDNYGRASSERYTWSIDHIIPLTKFDLTDREQMLKAVHYTNLQPLCSIENVRKSNK